VAVRFSILGSLEVRDGTRVRPEMGPQVSALLACLLAHANRVVSADQLMDMLWPAEPGRRDALQMSVSRLRKALEPDLPKAAGSTRVLGRNGGYEIVVAPGEFDADDFHRLARQGRDALAAGDISRARGLLGEALGLWRGPALADVRVDALLRDYVPALDEARIAATEDEIEARLRLGEPAGALHPLTTEHPTRERLIGFRMIALYREGRTDEALTVYQAYRATMVDQHGQDPTPDLDRIRDDILANRDHFGLPTALTVAGVNAGCQLPPAIPDLTGREAETAKLLALLSRTVPVVGISGQAGVGKTTLAVNLAHQLRPRFADGQLYVNLRGGSPEPAQPGAVLGTLLRALGVDGAALPADVEERAALLRSRLTDRQVLLLLDDAADTAQVRHLLPSAEGCAVIMTSRRGIAGLAGLHDQILPLLSDEAGAELLRRASNGRSGADPGAEAEIVAYCGRLPLALRIAGSLLAVRPHWTVRRLRDTLRDEHRRLDVLAVGDLGVRASLAVSDRSLSPDAARLLRLLALAPTADLPAWTAAAALDRPLPEVEDPLEELLEARLLEPAEPGHSWAATHVRFHNLTRLYAQEQAGRYPEADRRASHLRILHGWLGLAHDAVRAAPSCGIGLAPPPAGDRWTLPAADRAEIAGDPLHWLHTERATLLAAVQDAADRDLADLATELTVLLANYHSLHGLLDDRHTAVTAAHRAAERAGDRDSLAATSRILGELLLEEGRLAEGEERLKAALELAAGPANAHEHALTHLALGYTHRVTGRLAEAESAFRAAESELLALPDEAAAAHATAELGLILHRGGRTEDALAHWHAALDTFRAHNHPRGAGLVLRRIAKLHLSAGATDEAVRHLERAAQVCRAVGDRSGAAECARHLATAATTRGDLGAAETHLQQAATLLQGLGDRRSEAYVALDLGTLHHRADHPAQAHALLTRALRELTALGDTPGAAQATQALADLAAARGRMGRS
jgi:DNA-binding SARP family transcriptional activator